MWQPREMRRKDRKLEEKEAWALLEKGEYGVLATAQPDGGALPYATPLSYVAVEGKLYFHCALKGQKVDNLQANPQVCFCVVGATQPLYDGNFTTNYESVVVHGSAAFVQDEEEKRRVLVALCQKYLPAHMDKAEKDIRASMPATAVVCITPQEVSGKARR